MVKETPAKREIVDQMRLRTSALLVQLDYRKRRFFVSILCQLATSEQLNCQVLVSG